MAFDLIITFAGLCLFRRPKKDEQTIEVLLPPTEGDAPCCKDASSPASKLAVPGHFARLGYHVRYDPTLRSRPGKRFKEHEFAGKRLDLRPFGNPKSLNREFRHMDIVDITDVVTKPLDTKCAIGKVKIKAGSLCPGSVCEHSRGARWEIPGKKPEQHMATLVNWRIRGVKEVVEGGEGLELKVTDLDGKNEETCGILRPVDGQIRIYVFHTPQDELPSQGVPPFQEWTQGETEAEHFAAYYTLFPGNTNKDVPVFVKEEEDDEDAAEQGDPEAALSEASLRALPLVRFGRRYNCILTVVDDEGEA